MRKYILLFLFGTSSLFGMSQLNSNAFEMGFMGGGSYYIGDLNPNEHFVYSKPAFGAILRYNLSTRYSLRLTGTYGNVYASDANSSDLFSVQRNLNFKSKILEFAFGVEIDLLKYRINDMKYPISPYFFYEIAVFQMKPIAEHNGNDVELQQLGTEGQGTSLSTKNPYRLTQISLPLGIGVKFNLRRGLAISLEYGIRKTFTDYLDDVSGDYVDPVALSSFNGPTAGELSDPGLGNSGLSNIGFNRGNSSTKDWYAFYGLMITFKPFKKNICDMNLGR